MKIIIALALCSLACARSYIPKEKKMMGGGWSAIEDPEEIQEWARKSILEVNRRQDSDEFLKSRLVGEVRTQVVAGRNIEVEFVIGKTECDKPEDEEELQAVDEDSCDFLEDEEAGWQRCRVRHFEQSWTGTEEVTSARCEDMSSDDLADLLANSSENSSEAF